MTTSSTGYGVSANLDNGHRNIAPVDSKLYSMAFLSSQLWRTATPTVTGTPTRNPHGGLTLATPTPVSHLDGLVTPTPPVESLTYGAASDLATATTSQTESSLISSYAAAVMTPTPKIRHRGF
jgi:hypothetical protein